MSVLNKRELDKSPCIGVCSATALGDKYCVGCFRHERWVRNWNTYNRGTKRRINDFIKSLKGYSIMGHTNSKLTNIPVAEVDKYVDIPLTIFSLDLFMSVLHKYHLKYNKHPCIAVCNERSYYNIKNMSSLFISKIRLDEKDGSERSYLNDIPIYMVQGGLNEDDYLRLVFDEGLSSMYINTVYNATASIEAAE